ncbi:MAG TPA: hypothetical protein VN812_18205, partial [Candidatus Acidoferrales bacterium]|nr:hypothetical protein [Candidatus Acidoferrales bacterium]
AANGLLTLNHEQPLACDVDGDGAVTELDAKLILQRSLGSIMQFPVELTCGSNWAFVPTPLFPSENIHANEPALATWNCARGSIVIERPDQGPMYGMDFSAVMFGNCSGSWRPVSTQ